MSGARAAALSATHGAPARRELPPPGWRAALRAKLFDALFWLWLIGALVAITPWLLASRAAMWRRVRGIMRGVQWLLRNVVGTDYRVTGTEHIPDTPVIFALKHQSAWETMAFSLHRPEAVIVIKQELLNLPFFGWFAVRTEMIGVERGAGASALKKLLATARDRLAKGRSVAIFPEGTRVAPYTSGRYHPGIAALYRQLDVPVVPVAVNSGLFWPARGGLKRPGTITLAFLPPIPPGLARQDFVATLTQRIEEKTTALLDAARADMAPPPRQC